MSSNDKSIPLPVFSGKEEDYLMWKGKMKGFALAKGIWTAVTNKDKLPAKEDDAMDATAEKEGIQARTANSLLMAYLMNAFKKTSDTKLVMNHVQKQRPSRRTSQARSRRSNQPRPRKFMAESTWTSAVLSRMLPWM